MKHLSFHCSDSCSHPRRFAVPVIELESGTCIVMWVKVTISFPDWCAPFLIVLITTTVRLSLLCVSSTLYNYGMSYRNNFCTSY